MSRLGSQEQSQLTAEPGHGLGPVSTEPNAKSVQDLVEPKSPSKSAPTEHCKSGNLTQSSSDEHPTTSSSAMSRLRICFVRLRQWLAGGYREVIRSRKTPGFLVSLILHTSLLLTLAVWTIAGPGRGGFESGILVSPSAQSDDEPLELSDPMLASGDVTSEAMDSAAASVLDAPRGAMTVDAGSMGAAIADFTRTADLGAGTSADVSQSSAGQLMQAVASSTNASLAATGIEGREPQSRQKLALERGGTGDSEAAVELALEWLAAHQKPNGGWSLVHTKAECGPYCTHPGSQERYEPAATGLALLAFLGAGYTHRDGKHADVVKRGIYYLIQIMEETERGGSFLFNSPQGMYNQGVATFALCEAYQLSKDESLKAPCQKAVQFIVYAQHDNGGWGYLPKRPGDLTLTGWQTMALKSADAAGIYIPAQTIVRIDNFLDTQCEKNKVFYGYAGPAPKNETCTAIGLLLRMFRGWPHSDPRVLEGASYLERQGVSSHDMYRNYYLTLLLYHVGGRTFTEWNPRMRDSLVQAQNRKGHAAGSWYFEDKWGEVGGRHYTTAMAAMTLEVYYRFSPLYQNSDKPFEY